MIGWEEHSIELIGAEVILVLLALALGFLRPRLGVSRLRPVARGFAALASKRTRAIWLAALIAFGVSWGLSALRWPVPRIQDEFSYLLAADTFSSGRLTNPPPPLREHFESKHILVTPTYQSKYPPGQGVALAVGQVLTGQPLVGVWISFALSCAALCWMLQARFPPRWALFGAILPVLHFGVLDSWYRGRFFYWSQSYWGGALAMLGGALLYGALFRMARKVTVRDAVLLALGLAVLANSRPYEGLLASVPAAVFFLVLPFRKAGPGWQLWFRKGLIPILCGVAVAAGAMGFYNYRVTGDPLLLPHWAHERSVGMASHFLVSRLGLEEESGGDALQVDGESGGDAEERFSTRSTWLSHEYKRRFVWLYTFFLGPILTLPFVAGVVAARRSWELLAVISFGAVLLGNIVTISGFPHYFAPVAGLIVTLVLSGTRQLQRVRWQGKRVGRGITRGLILGVCTMFGLGAALHVYAAKFVEWPPLWSERRAYITDTLTNSPGKHLILVRGPKGEHNRRNDEWVYNRADIDGAKVVWARELDSGSNARLLEYFGYRSPFLLEVDKKAWRIGPLVKPPRP